jgi:hypothetical protein
MQENAPRVFRWVEHMLVPEIQSPEFFDRPVAYPADDNVPPTLAAILTHLLTGYGQTFQSNVLAVNDYLARNEIPAGGAFSEEHDQPQLEGCNPHVAWITQRALDYYAGLDAAARKQCHELMQQCGGVELVETPLTRRIERRNGRLHAV